MSTVASKPLTQRLSYHLGQFKRDLKGWMKSGSHTGKVEWAELTQQMARRANCSADTLENQPYRSILKDWLNNWNVEISGSASTGIKLHKLSRSELVNMYNAEETRNASLLAELTELRERYRADRAEFEVLLKENEYQRLLMMAHSIPFDPTTLSKCISN
jgi:hypothetical protein